MFECVTVNPSVISITQNPLAVIKGLADWKIKVYVKKGEGLIYKKFSNVHSWNN